MGKIDRGFVVFIGVDKNDREDDASYLAEKIANIRLFDDEKGKFNFSLLDTDGEVLVVSQFTLMADARKGRRPDFLMAASPEIAERLIEKFVSLLKQKGIRVATGRFRKHMLVEIYNDGPVTVMLDSHDRNLRKSSH